MTARECADWFLDNIMKDSILTNEHALNREPVPLNAGYHSERSTKLSKLSSNTWFISNKLTLNTAKTEFILIGSRQKLSTLSSPLELSVDIMFR